MACREMKWDSMAFVFLNHYLDLSEAIEEGDATMIDNSDFVGTDIPAPFDYALPKQQFLDEQHREDVRDWVLQISMNQEVDQTLETRTCRKCKSEVYEASLTCSNCKFKSPGCLATGYPIASQDKTVTCGKCSSAFDKGVWNLFIQQTGQCPWCGAEGRPVY